MRKYKLTPAAVDWLAVFHRIYDCHRMAPVCDDGALFYFHRGYSPTDAARICTDVDPTNA